MDVKIVDNMGSGEKELRQVFEEVTTKNLKTTIDFSQETRKMFRDLEKKVTRLESVVVTQNEINQGLKSQIQTIQAKLYSMSVPQ